MKKKFFLKNLMIFVLPLLVPLLILGTLAIFITQQNISVEISKNNMNLLSQTSENIELILRELDSLSISFNNDASVTNNLNLIMKNSELTLENIIALDLIKGMLNAQAYTRPYFHSIYVYYENSNQRFLSTSTGLTSLQNYGDISWYDSYLEQKSLKNFWTETRKIKSRFDTDPSGIVTVYNNISNGVIVLNIRQKYIEDILNNLSTMKDQVILVLDENNQIIFNNNLPSYVEAINLNKIVSENNTFFNFTSQNVKYSVSKLDSKKYPWEYVTLVPQSSLYIPSFELSKITLFLLILSFILGLILTYYITRKNYKQVLNIISILNSVENGEPLPSFPDRIKNEYSYIIHNIIKTFIEQSYLKLQLSEKKYRMQAMQLIALQAQINPHFLYNTLNAIYWETFGISEKSNRANNMVKNLSEIVKYSLSDPGKMVSLDEEIKNALSYVEIMQLRYMGKFNVIWSYDDTIKSSNIIKLLFQPLIENSIYHGIKEKEGKGYIKIKISKHLSILTVSVIDNGIGISKDKLLQIRDRLNVDSEFSQHIGLFNTDKRIKLTYGKEYGLNIRSRQGLGTVVYIQLPA